MVIDLSIDNSRALIVYVDPNQKKDSLLSALRKKLFSFCANVFVIRKKAYITLILLYVLCFFFGSCVAGCDNGFTVLMRSSVIASNGIHVLALIISLFSGFTVFGKPVSVVCAIYFAFVFGVVQYDLFLHRSGILLIASFCAIILISILILLVLSEVFHFSWKAAVGKSTLFEFKPCISYCLFTSFLIFCIYFSHYLIYNLL